MAFSRFTLIAGPCALEDAQLNLRVAREVALAADLGMQPIFKGSFDKANRTSLSSPRGVGIEAGLAALRHVREETGLPVLTDIHEPWQAERAGGVVDILQIPAFLCRQSDLLRAAGATGLPVNVKKGQWMSPEAMAGTVEKLKHAGAEAVAVTDRGTIFGYGDLVADMRSFARIRDACGCPAIFDASHSVQRPGQGATTGGRPEHTPALARAAVAAGSDGLFIETHPEPRSAPSDAATMLPLEALGRLLEEVSRIREVLAEDPRTLPPEFPRPERASGITGFS